MSFKIEEVLSAKEDVKSGIVYAHLLVSGSGDSRVRKVREVFDLEKWSTVVSTGSYVV